MRIQRWIIGLSILGVLTLLGVAGQPAAASPPSGRNQVSTLSGAHSPVSFLSVRPSSSESLTLKLNELNGSGDFGTATLTTVGVNQVRVVIQMGGAMPMEHNHPAHIHQGTCSTLDPKPAYPLNPVTNGQSDTTVPVALTTLLASSYAINLHESPEAINTYTACGDITTLAAVGAPAAGAGGSMGNMTGGSNTMPPTGQGPGVPPWLPWAGLAGLALLAGGLLQRQGRRAR